MRWKILIAFIVITISGNFALAKCPSADLTGDCFVDYEDFALMAAQWLTTDPCVPDDMAYIPDGEFQMGDHHEGRYDACDVHAVFLDSFFMSKYEITNRQYCQYLNSVLGSSIYVSIGVVYGNGNNRPYCDTYSYDSNSQIDYNDVSETFDVRTKGGRDMSNDPMVQVSWYGAAAYCNWRSGQKGYESLYDPCDPFWPCDFNNSGYRLATEAEWEYAARGGEHSPYYRFPWGDTISHSQANYYAKPFKYSYDISPTTGYHPDWNDGIKPYTSVVGSFSTNGYGLYDMAGNVWEWCNDWYSSTYYRVSPYDNPQGPALMICRVLRGGEWSGLLCQVAVRSSLHPETVPEFRTYNYGFRVVLDLN